METAFRLGIDRPRCRDRKPRLHEALGERVPGPGRLVGKHQGHDAVRLERPAALREDGRHPLLIVLPGKRPRALLAPESRRIGDRLVVLVGEVAAEQLGKDMAGGALEPDVEEVRQLRIHDVVVVGRVHDHRVDAAVLDVVEAVPWLAGDGDGWRDVLHVVGTLEQVVRAGVRSQTNQRDQLVDALGGLLDGPVVLDAIDKWRHLCIGPDEREVVAVENVSDASARGSIPVAGPVVIVKQGIDR